MLNLTKIRQVGTDLFHAEGRTGRQADRWADARTNGQTDITKLMLAFRSFANSPKNYAAEPGCASFIR
jgi:hypothetical protein